ncbi:MAG: ABC transporter permease subunit [Vallitalea sp.]|jgi:arabinogalactan oligomer/maltooligosaccharide transport system permease protein|nr:ABC transporter permease subunit [Vallitalea sp.]
MRKKVKLGKIMDTIGANIAVIIITAVWIFPLIWLFATAFNGQGTMYDQKGFFPRVWSLKNFKDLFTDTSYYIYPKWLINTLYVAVISCIGSTYMNIVTAYSMSRFRFKGRKTMMKGTLIIGMFPGFMAMVAVYLILMMFNLLGNLNSLVIVYVAGAGLGFLVAKGFFDTINSSMEEAARIDGANNLQVFTKIMLPNAKPILVYTSLMAFAAPWSDYIFAKMILGPNRDNWTVAIGLMEMAGGAGTGDISQFFSRFAAGSMLISVPITILFISLQKYITLNLGGSVKG